MNQLARMAIFAQVVESDGFGKAAIELGMSTSSISQHISALEAYLEVALLHRSTRKLSLTEAGNIYYQECVKVVNAAAQGRQKVAALKDQLTGELRIAVSSFMSCHVLVPALNDFIKAHPKLVVRFEVNDRNIDLIENRIDIALRVSHLHDSQLVARKVGWFQDVLCAAPDHPFVRSPEDLEKMDFLLFTPVGDSTTIELWNGDGVAAKVRLRSRLSANHAQTLRMLTIQGHGIARLLFACVKDDIAAGKLKLVLPDWHFKGFGAYIITPRRDDLPMKVLRCIEHIQSYFDKNPELL